MKKYLLIITLIFIGSLPVNAQAATWHIPAEQPPVTYTGSTGVKLSAYVKNGQFGMSIKYPGKKWTKVPLPSPFSDFLSTMTEVDSIQRGADDKAIVIGAGGEVPEVVIVDLATGKIIDNFLCNNPDVSPDGRFIAYIKFYPAHFLSGRTDIVMIYDLEKSPSQNRPSGIGIDDPGNVGEAVYPLGATAISGNTELPPDKVDFVTSESPSFFWAPDSSGFAFSVIGPHASTLLPAPNMPKYLHAPKRYKSKSLLVLVKTPWAYPSVPVTLVATADTCVTGRPACYASIYGLKFGTRGLHADFLGGLHKYFSYGEFHKPKLFYNYGIKPKREN